MNVDMKPICTCNLPFALKMFHIYYRCKTLKFHIISFPEIVPIL